MGQDRNRKEKIKNGMRKFLQHDFLISRVVSFWVVSVALFLWCVVRDSGSSSTCFLERLVPQGKRLKKYSTLQNINSHVATGGFI